MARINYGRVVVGGLIAGLVANLFDFVINTYLLVDESAEMIARLNLNGEKVASSMWIWIGIDFVWGLLLVWTYAAVRPRFGPGPKTALLAGLVVWLGTTLNFVGLTAMGVFTQPAFLKSGLFYLVSSLAASLAGAATYKEE